MYFGEYCEHIATYIIILIICSTIIFIIVLDILKYVFHIDVSHKELQRIRRRRFVRKPKVQVLKEPRIAVRFSYVDKEEMIANITSAIKN
jgi:hypothetical protein